MNKSASSIIMMIFEVLVVILVIVIVTKTAIGMGSSDTVIKINTANDLAMMVNTLVGTPGEAVVAYPYNVSAYIFILDSGSITVMKRGDILSQKVIRTFSLPKGFMGEGVVEENAKICLEKKSGKILLRECRKDES